MDSSNSKEDKLMTNLLLDVHKDVGHIREDIGEIKGDLRTHIKRTDMLESEVKWIHRQVWLVHGALGLVSLVAILAAIYRNFGNG